MDRKTRIEKYRRLVAWCFRNPRSLWDLYPAVRGGFAAKEWLMDRKNPNDWFVEQQKFIKRTNVSVRREHTLAVLRAGVRRSHPHLDERTVIAVAEMKMAADEYAQLLENVAERLDDMEHDNDWR